MWRVSVCFFWFFFTLLFSILLWAVMAADFPSWIKWLVYLAIPFVAYLLAGFLFLFTGWCVVTYIRCRDPGFFSSDEAEDQSDASQEPGAGGVNS